MCKDFGRDAVEGHLEQLKQLELIASGCTEREMKNLAIIVTQMEKEGFDPWREQYVCHVDMYLVYRQTIDIALHWINYCNESFVELRTKVSREEIGTELTRAHVHVCFPMENM